MIGVLGKTGIVHSSDRRMRGQEAGQSERVLVLSLHSQAESFESAVKKKAGVRVEAAAQVVESMEAFFDQLLLPDHGSGHDIGMSVEVLCGAMER